MTITPLPLVMRLRMPLRERLGVVFVFGLGLVVIVAGVVRTYYIWKGLIDSYDVTWYAYPLWIAAAVEIDVAIVSTNSGRLCTWIKQVDSFLFPRYVHVRQHSSRSSFLLAHGDPSPHKECPTQAANRQAKEIVLSC